MIDGVSRARLSSSRALPLSRVTRTCSSSASAMARPSQAPMRFKQRAEVTAFFGLQPQGRAQLLGRDLPAAQQDLTELVAALAASLVERRNLLVRVLARFVRHYFRQFSPRVIALVRFSWKGSATGPSDSRRSSPAPGLEVGRTSVSIGRRAPSSLRCRAAYSASTLRK